MTSQQQADVLLAQWQEFKARRPQYRQLIAEIVRLELRDTATTCRRGKYIVKCDSIVKDT